MPADRLPLLTRAFGYVMVSAVFLYLVNNYLVYWQGLPGPYALALHLGQLAKGHSVQQCLSFALCRVLRCRGLCTARICRVFGGHTGLTAQRNCHQKQCRKLTAVNCQRLLHRILADADITTQSR